MQSFRFNQPIRIRASACTGGAMEKDGPLGDYLDVHDETGKFGAGTGAGYENSILLMNHQQARQKL